MLSQVMCSIYLGQGLKYDHILLVPTTSESGVLGTKVVDWLGRV